jgi:hypothetical protein
MGVHQLSDRDVTRMSSGPVSIRRCHARCREPEAEIFNYVARVIRALEDRGATDESDPTSMSHVVELALGRCPARFAELA